MSLELHRLKEQLGGVVYLLTVDATPITGNPLHIKRFINNYGENGVGVIFQGNTFVPYAYEIDKVTRNTKSTKQGVALKLSDPDFLFTRFIDQIGGSLEGARIYEYKVYERFLDGGIEANPNAYVKRMDHVVDYVATDSNNLEITVNTIDPLSRDLMVPKLQFSAGEPNSTVSKINIFPAASREITQGR